MAYAREVTATLEWEELLRAQAESSARDEHWRNLHEILGITEEVRDPPVQKMFGEDQRSWSEELKTLGTDAIKATLFNEDEEEKKEKCQSFLDSVFVELDKKEIEQQQRKIQGLTKEKEVQVQQESTFDRFRGPNGLQLFMEEGKKVMMNEIVWFKNKRLVKFIRVLFDDMVKSGQMSKEEHLQALISCYKQQFEVNLKNITETLESLEAEEDEADNAEKIDFLLLDVSNSFVSFFAGFIKFVFFSFPCRKKLKQ